MSIKIEVDKVEFVSKDDEFFYSDIHLKGGMHPLRINSSKNEFEV